MMTDGIKQFEEALFNFDMRNIICIPCREYGLVNLGTVLKRYFRDSHFNSSITFCTIACLAETPSLKKLQASSKSLSLNISRIAPTMTTAALN